MSHYFGFGNLKLDTLSSPQGKVTGHDASGKFKERLMVKQRKLEEMMMENRLRKLINEEERLQKQIEIANKHTVLADEV